MKKVHHQYSGGHAVWTCHIISTEEVVQYMATKTIQGVVGGCIYLGKWYFTDKITQRFRPTVMNQDVPRSFQDANIITFESLNISSLIL